MSFIVQLSVLACSGHTLAQHVLPKLGVACFDSSAGREATRGHRQICLEGKAFSRLWQAKAHPVVLFLPVVVAEGGALPL